MATRKKAYSLFEVTGIELEYMVVDKNTLSVSPTVDELFKDTVGKVVSDVERGDVEWSNELTAHVVEMKTAKPTKEIASFEKKFTGEVRAMNETLGKRGRMLLPGAAHPLMDPMKESVLWSHEYSEVYGLYNTIFDCRGHGWSNLQSVHLNLPFANDDEFSKLHTAIRMLLPIIPALSASSPILDGKPTGMMDTRMHHYLTHQQRLPQLMGSLIPEAVFSQEDYYRVIFEPIARALQPFDKEQVMDHHFANSRGAIARFDRGAIEIRVVDVQECPGADLAIAEMIVAVLKALVKGKWVSNYLQRAWHEGDLLVIFKDMIKDAGNTVIANRDYLLMFGLMRDSLTANELWRHLYQQVRADLSEAARLRIAHILDHGCLAQRILKHTGPKPTREKIVEVYRELAVCLQENRQLA
jgi:gamma-glutamyl:cysteine ligase YbdK (ATP-grasp superfamily)